MGNWDSIAGQKKLKEYFTRAVERRQVSHAYILEGEPGTPRAELADGFARMLQCEKGTGCGQCHSCKAFDSGNHPDVIHVTHEKPELIRIDEIRRQLVDDMGIRPYSSPYKIYLVEDAELMNTAAQNALLKTLEEPPYYGIIVLITVNANRFLPTILSRSIVLKCQNEGSGLELLDPEQRRGILSVLKQAWKYDRTDMAKVTAEWKGTEIPVSGIMNLVRVWLRDVLVWKATETDRQLVLAEEVRGIREAGDRYSYAQLNRILACADETERRIASNVNYELAMELFLVEWKERPEPAEDPGDEQEDLWGDMPFPDFEEARFLSESYESAMLESSM